MTSPCRLFCLVLVALAPTQVVGTDIVACIVADTQNNSSYYGMATTVTRLKCEFTNKDYYPTLPELYRQGWRLIQVLGGIKPCLRVPEVLRRSTCSNVRLHRRRATLHRLRPPFLALRPLPRSRRAPPRPPQPRGPSPRGSALGRRPSLPPAAPATPWRKQKGRAFARPFRC